MEKNSLTANSGDRLDSLRDAGDNSDSSLTSFPLGNQKWFCLMICKGDFVFASQTCITSLWISKMLNKMHLTSFCASHFYFFCFLRLHHSTHSLMHASTFTASRLIQLQEVCRAVFMTRSVFLNHPFAIRRKSAQRNPDSSISNITRNVLIKTESWIFSHRKMF